MMACESMSNGCSPSVTNRFIINLEGGVWHLLSAHVYILSHCVAMHPAGVILAAASHMKGLGR